MNAITTTTRAGAGSLAPQTFGEAVEFSKMLARSGMVPKDYVNKPEAVMVALQWGAEVGLGPLQALNGISIINGKPSLWGDAALALVRGHPACAGVREGIEGEGEARVGWCEVTRRGEQPQRRTFSVADAKKAGLWNKPGPWQNYPDRMLQLRARGFAIRDVFPDALRGVITAEEAQDMPPEPRSVPNLHREGQRSPEVSPGPTLAAEVAAARATLPVIAPSGTLHQVPRERWLAAIGKALGGLEDAMAMKGWSDAMAEHLGTARALDDALAHQAEQIIAGRIFELAGPPDAEPEPGAVEPEEVL
jgi:hypothetical protein